jgi:hypothetical protein
MEVKTQTLRINSVIYLLAAMLLMAGATTAMAEINAEPRVSKNSQGQGIQQDNVGSLDEFEPLITTGSRNKSTRASGQPFQTKSQAKSQADLNTPNVEFWIYDADVELYSDWDRDGYYVGIDLNFDADTIYTAADVYAVIYLSYDFGPWNEFSSTDDFTILGASGNDEYSIETELVSGYMTGDYDLLIELFDTYDGSFVASFGPEDSQKLSFLPLEDAGRDTPPPTTTVIVNESGGGSLGLMGLLALLGVAGLARSRI